MAIVVRFKVTHIGDDVPRDERMIRARARERACVCEKKSRNKKKKYKKLRNFQHDRVLRQLQGVRISQRTAFMLCRCAYGLGIAVYYFAVFSDSDEREDTVNDRDKKKKKNESIRALYVIRAYTLYTRTCIRGVETS